MSSTLKKRSVAEFIREVKQEVSKVSWLSRNEVIMSTLMVFVMVAIVAVFFFVVDSIIYKLIQLILGF